MEELMARIEGIAAEIMALRPAIAEAKQDLYNHQKVLSALEDELNELIPDGSNLHFVGFTVKSQWTPPSVQVECDPKELPTEFKRTKVIIEADKVALHNHINSSGELIPGVAMVRRKIAVIKPR